MGLAAPQQPVAVPERAEAAADVQGAAGMAAAYWIFGDCQHNHVVGAIHNQGVSLSGERCGVIAGNL